MVQRHLRDDKCVNIKLTNAHRRMIVRKFSRENGMGNDFIREMERDDCSQVVIISAKLLLNSKYQSDVTISFISTWGLLRI